MNQPLSLLEALASVYPIILTMDVLRYVIAASALSAVLAVFARALAHRRIQARRATRADRHREIRRSLITGVVFSMVGFTTWFLGQFGVFHISNGEISVTRLALELLVFIVIHDAYFYWMHRSIHDRRWFRRVHAVHHQSRTPTPWAAYSFAIPEAVLEALILPLVTLFLPMHEFTVGLFMTHMITRNVIGHAGTELFPRWWLRVPVARWITTTTHHDLHHATGRYNFGLYFTWWDRWMGTEHPEYAARFAAAVATGEPAKANAPARSVARSALPFVAACALGIHSDSLAQAERPGNDSQGVEHLLPYGEWVTPGFGSVVQLAPCAVRTDERAEPRLCGQIVWLWEATDVDGQPMRDQRNPEPQLRDRLLVGAEILWRFGQAEPGVWTGGRVYNPDDGRTYRGSIRQIDPDTLRLKGCALRVFCKTQTWRRRESLAPGPPATE